MLRSCSVESPQAQYHSPTTASPQQGQAVISITYAASSSTTDSYRNATNTWHAFEVWLAAKLNAIDSPTVRTPVEQFATWHHLRHLRTESKPPDQNCRPAEHRDHPHRRRDPHRARQGTATSA